VFFGGEQFNRGEPRRFFFKHIVRKIFLEDWAMKLIALIITLGLWLGVTGLSTPTTTRFSGVPLALRVSNNTEITNSPLQEVDIVLSGDKRRMAQVNKSDLILSLDLSDVQPGDRVVQLTPDNVLITLPTGIKLEEIQPNRIAVKIEAVDEKEIPVKAQTEGDPAEGFEVYSETVTPAKVRVRGPASFIKSLDFVSTDKIDLANRDADFTVRQIPISVSNPKATVLDTVADVSFRIGEKRVEKIFLVPTASGKRATVVLYGPRSIFDNVKATDLKVQQAKSDTGQETPQLDLPQALQANVEVRRIKVY
jgi:YbbR domain-containing protein